MARRGPSNPGGSAAEAPTDAAGWVARMGSDQATRDDQAALSAWLKDDPDRAQAYASHAEIWDGLGALGKDASARAILRGDSAQAGWAPWAHRRIGRRGMIGGLAGAAAAASAALVAAPQLLGPGKLYRTARGEQRRVSLADGSVMTLNTSTRVRVDFGEHERRLVLESGQAHFQVAKDAGRPFRVFVGADEVRAVGTAFDVRKDGRTAQVTLEEGVVALYRPQAAGALSAASGDRPAPPRRPAAILRPGQQARLAPKAPVAVAEVDVGREQAWRLGRIILDAVPLADAVAEVNRYGGRRVVLSDPTLADVKISGVFHTGRPEDFVDAVVKAFPIQLSREDSGELVLAPV